MKASKSTFSTAAMNRTTQSEKTQKFWSEGIEFNPGSALALDVRSLRAAVEYPTMFANPLGALCIDRNWATAFTLTCMEIDAFLGSDKRGFHWRLLGIEGDEPHWYWALGKQYDHQVLIAGQLEAPSVVIEKSVADPHDALRNAIGFLVQRGMHRAAFFSQGVGSSGEIQ